MKRKSSDCAWFDDSISFNSVISNLFNYRGLMNKNYYYQLAMTIDKMQQQGKQVIITKLPSTINKPRKTYL